MPTKCLFCRRKYTRAGAYEKHLRTAHAKLDIVLASTVRYASPANYITDTETSLLHHPLVSGHPDSDYEFDLDPTEYERDDDVVQESDTEETNDAAPSPADKPMDYAGAGEAIGDVNGFEQEYSDLCADPWAPFTSAHGFKLASWFIQSKVPKSRINEYFSNGLGDTASVGYGSMHTLENHLRSLDPYSPYLQWFEGQVDDGSRCLPFFYRNILDCVRYLLRQIAYRDDLVYAPRREYDSEGQRLYSEMHTADWWWDVQETLPPGATIVPIIGMSDQTHLSNFSGDKKAWPVYITLGNLPSTRRNRPGSMAVLLLALLPVPPKFSKSSSADELQRQINADTLRGVFELILEPLQETALEGVPIDCADGNVRRCFPILSAWIADHMENVALHGIKSNACPKCEVPPAELGTDAGTKYPARDYASFCEPGNGPRSPTSKTHDAQAPLGTPSTTIGQNVFHGLQRVSAPDLYKPDMLHTVYLGLFKHMMDWIQGFLKKHGRAQAFDDAWKALPPYPGFFVPKKAYREVTQWQGKEMRNLGRCLLGVLAVALRQPDSAQVLPFKHALGCVRALVDFNMMAQYRSHTPETLAYMEQYLNQFHKTKEIFLEFRVSKRTRAKVDEQRRELRHQRAQVNQPVSTSERRRVRGDDRAEENDRRMDLIHTESHFNFIKMHLLCHFHDHVRQFGNIPMYSTEFGELAHKDQIKDGWRRSNKNDAARQILHTYGRQHAIRMRLLNLDSLRRRGVDLPADVLHHLDKTSTVSGPGPRYRILKGRRGDVSDIMDFCKVLEVSSETMCRELIRYSRHNLPTERQLPQDPAILRSLPVELLTQLEIPVPAFQDPDVHDIHRARCTGALLFRNQASRNDWVWVRAGGEDMYGALKGRLPAKLVALFKIRDYTCGSTVRRLACVQKLTAVNSGRLSDTHGLVTVQLREDAREFTVVDIGTILGLAHLIPETDRRWLVNSRIDLRTFNEIY